MKIGIDCRLWGRKHGGIGRYVEELVTNLQEVDKDNDYVVFCRKGDLEDVPDKKGWWKVVADVGHYSLSEQMFLHKIFLREKLDLLHVPHFNVPFFYNRPYVATIHDLFWHGNFGFRYTTRFAPIYLLKYIGYRLVVRKVVRGARKIIVPTEFVKKDLVRRFGLTDDEVVVSYGAGIGRVLGTRQKAIGLLNKHKIVRPYVLYVGSFSPHKNLVRLLEAMKLLSYEVGRERDNVGLWLVVAGGRGLGFDEVKARANELGISERVIFTGSVGDDCLSVLYRYADMLVFPTLSEGFGLPGIEAMECGCPVVCSDIPVLREVYGDAALYFDPMDVADIANKIMRLYTLRNTPLGITRDKQGKHGSTRIEEMVKKGRRRARLYSWRKMADNVLGVYKEAVAG